MSVPVNKDLTSQKPAKSKSTPPPRRDAERSHRFILDAALVEFSEKGFSGARIDTIAAQAGVSKPMIYSYYGDKDDLYAAALLEDVYHIWWDPDIQTQIERAGKKRLLAFHLCDWLVPTADMLTDRGMMGDGIIDIPRFRALVEAQGFDGLNEVEIFSAENWWKRDPDEVLQEIISRAEQC